MGHMFDAKDLLGKLVQTRMSGSSDERLTHAMGPQGLGRPENPVADLLGGLFGKGAGAQGGGGGLGGLLGQGGGLADLGRRAEEMLGASKGSVQSTLQDKNQLAMGGLAALAGAVLGGRRGMGGAVGGGLLALLGSLAFSALKNKGTTSAQPAELVKDVPLGLREPQTPAEESELQNTALLAIRAMINAAKADGAVDGGEMSRIMGKLSEDGADNEARDFVMSELQKPLDLESLVRNVKSPEQAVQVYGASFLAIEVDTDAERDYLQKLAERLGLDGETVERVHSSLGISKGA
jgi:uncharacterized membrane protein YebE (DUF533 family)